MKQKSKILANLTMIQVLMIMVVLLITISVATTSFGKFSDARIYNNNYRIAVSYISNQAKSYDIENALAVKQSPYGDALVMKDFTPGGTFETRYYLCNGELMEEYSLESAEFSPQDATSLVAIESFDVQLDGGTLTIDTSYGKTMIYLRTTS